MDGKKRSRKDAEQLPIDTVFNLPSPLPPWPPGGGFAKGTMDLGGGLEIRLVSSFTKLWTAREGGADSRGATFFSPSDVPDGFSALGHYGQPNNRPLSGWLLVARDTTAASDDAAALQQPADYTLLWSSESSSIDQDGRGYFWQPVAAEGYAAVGLVVTGSPAKPPPDAVSCVRDDLTDLCEAEDMIWSSSSGGGTFSIYTSRPATRGVGALSAATGTFVSSSSSTACLRNTSPDFASSMPNLDQIEALLGTYSPWLYFHGDEQYLPSSVSWFFGNGALLYSKATGADPSPIDPAGLVLPQGGTNDGEYWIDLPAGDDAERVKKGDLGSSEAYVHAKPMLGATFTDLAIWVFYPFNGPASAKVGPVRRVRLGRIGEHVGDWEHVTLRISNLDGQLRRMYFAEHSSGVWVDATELEFASPTSNKPVAYESLHGHANYPKAGLVLQGGGGVVGIRNDTEKGELYMDTGARYKVVAAEYLGPPEAAGVAEPAWLNYSREWGPKISYNIAGELRKAMAVLPAPLRKLLAKAVGALPAEVLGEEGPTGPKMKTGWTGDEVD